MRAVWIQVIDEFCAAALGHGLNVPPDWIADDAWHKCKGGAYRLNSQLPFFGFFAVHGDSPIVWRHDVQRILTRHQEALIAAALAACPKLALPARAAAARQSEPAGPSIMRRERPRARAQALLASILASGPRGAVEIQAAAADAGLSITTLRRAARTVSVTATREGFGRGGRWTWALP